MQETWLPSASLSRPNVSSMAAGAWPVEGEPQPQVRDPLWRTAHAPFFFPPAQQIPIGPCQNAHLSGPQKQAPVVCSVKQRYI